jgi:hypothetical protein
MTAENGHSDVYQPKNILVTGGAGEEWTAGWCRGLEFVAQRLRTPRCLAGFIASWVVIKLVKQRPDSKVGRERTSAGGWA